MTQPKPRSPGMDVAGAKEGPLAPPPRPSKSDPDVLSFLKGLKNSDLGLRGSGFRGLGVEGLCVLNLWI